MLQNELLRTIGADNIDKITAFSTDTCPIIYSLHSELEAIPTFGSAPSLSLANRTQFSY